MDEEIKIFTKDDNTTIKVLKVLEGIKGNKGDKGDTGEQGPKGDTGEISQQQLDEGLALKEDVANKVSSFQATTDDEHYPSEKLVKDSLDMLDTNKANIDLDNLSVKGKTKITDLNTADFSNAINLVSDTIYYADKNYLATISAGNESNGSNIKISANNDMSNNITLINFINNANTTYFAGSCIIPKGYYYQAHFNSSRHCYLYTLKGDIND